MSKKLALKRLKASDLSFFHSYLDRFPQAKQKGFNLDKGVIESQLFPELTAVVGLMPDQRSPVALTLFGPGRAPPYLLMRKVLKQQKNWRLNGETVRAPDEDRERYDILAPGDLALMEFTGTGAPNAIKVVLLSAGHPDDSSTHAALNATFPDQSMVVVSEADIEQAIGTGEPHQDHPIRDWLDKDVLEAIGLGSGEAIERLAARRRGRGLSVGELQMAKAKAEAVGRLGEVLLDHHFSTIQPHAQIASHEWTANVNAVSPFDFLLTYSDGTSRHVDAKSTAGPFTNPIHLSLSEIRFALGSGVRYHLCRLYNVKNSGASFRVALNIEEKLRSLDLLFSALPTGVKFDSLSFDPGFFGFSETENFVSYDDEAEAE